MPTRRELITRTVVLDDGTEVTVRVVNQLMMAQLGIRPVVYRPDQLPEDPVLAQQAWEQFGKMTGALLEAGTVDPATGKPKIVASQTPGDGQISAFDLTNEEINKLLTAILGVSGGEFQESFRPPGTPRPSAD